MLGAARGASRGVAVRFREGPMNGRSQVTRLEPGTGRIQRDARPLTIRIPAPVYRGIGGARHLAEGWLFSGLKNAGRLC